MVKKYPGNGFEEDPVVVPGYVPGVPVPVKKTIGRKRNAG
jgi:hypothetical protein